ncbi:MAG: HEAT repeat domain-containing protein [Deltaproteobacteria bacterium]|nr:HEAT repeat domain-containing protein [Deltaproteobacteria bacterium]
MSEVRSVPVAELRQHITDPSELGKGTEIADRGGLAHLSRHGNKLFADAAGSGSAPYKTQIVFGDDKLTGRCSCMAARSRPFCKHAAALLVSWARTPEAFVVSEAPPAPAMGEGATKRAAVKRGKVDPTEARKKGVEQASTLLSELWQTGVFALAADRATQVAELATSLRELGLRRLAAHTLELAELLRLAARRDDSFPQEAYASLVASMWLTVRKLEKHLAGEPLAEEHVEELIGRTWTKKDRKPIADLELVEYAFVQRTTPDGFLLRESRLIEVPSGDHFSEKQILPAALAKRLPPKESYAGRVLRGASGSLFPSFAPRRLDLEAKGADAPVDEAILQRALGKAMRSVSQAIAALSERRRDVFAPPWIPVLVRIDWIVPTGRRVRFVDTEGGTLFLAGGREQEDALMAALVGVEALAVLGDVALQGALPCLFPLAVVGRKDGIVALLPLGDEGANRAEEPETSRAATWAEDAKSAGVSKAATWLGEVRDDLAAAFQEGVVGMTPRFVDPLVSRLRELQLAKQADALAALSGKDAIETLDGLVKLYQVLGIALTRLVGTAPVDRDGLVRLPTMPSVAIPKPEAVLAPDVAVARESRGELNRYERAYHVGAYYEAADEEALVRETHPHWGDGFATPFVLRAAASRPELAVRSAMGVLGERERSHAWLPCPSRLTKLTALRVLASSSRPEARAALVALWRGEPLDAGFTAQLQRVLNGPQMPAQDVEAHCRMVIAGSLKDDRIAAIDALASAAVYEAIPTLRAAMRDRTTAVRRAAAYALANLGDTQALDTWVTWLQGGDRELTNIAVHAIGFLGDVRGAAPILAAYASGVSPGILTETLVLLGPWVLAPVLDLVDTQPELAKRASVTSLVKQFPARSVGTFTSWIAEAGDDPAKVLRRASLALDACSARPDVHGRVVEWIRATYPTLSEGADKESRALKRKMTKQERAKKAAAPTT